VRTTTCGDADPALAGAERLVAGVISSVPDPRGAGRGPRSRGCGGSWPPTSSTRACTGCPRRRA